MVVDLLWVYAVVAVLCLHVGWFYVVWKICFCVVGLIAVNLLCCLAWYWLAVCLFVVVFDWFCAGGALRRL